jgi:gamma-glutamyltranspeptidase/glutathione hydrolase
VQEFHIGLGAIAVPGAVAGLFHVHQRLGRLPLTAIAAPAIHHARAGISVSPFLAYLYSLLEPILLATPAAQGLYTVNGRLLQAGDQLQMPDLALTLETLVEEGHAYFYEGAIAQQIVRDCQALGGYLTQEDLQRYQVIERSPLCLQYRHVTCLTNPPPSSGGTLIGFALKLLDQVELSRYDFGEVKHLACLTRAMALTNLARRDGYDASLYEPDVATRFLADAHCAPYQQALQSMVNKLGSTTHVSVIDAEGNAASVTTSNGEGSSYVIPGTAIMLNNMLGEEDLHPHGFHQWVPSQRISSMMAPTILLEDHQPKLVLGSGGSNRIRTAILQVISNVVDFEMPLETAIAAPRMHWERGTLHLEPGYSPTAVQQSQTSDTVKIIPWQKTSLYFGGVHAVARDSEGQFHGVGDDRRGGAVVIA